VSRNLFLVLLLTLVYAWTLASFKPLDLLTGALLASVLLVATRGKLFRGSSVAGGLLPRRSADAVVAVIRGHAGGGTLLS
jgi:multisubunit Na+/H+ antiporter MnhE subunit